MEGLNLFEHAAYLRIYVGRLACRFSRVLDGIADGRWHLTALKLVGPYLTEENSESLLECIRGKPRRAIETELARLFPKEDVPNRVRKLADANSANRLDDEVHSNPQLYDDSVRTAVQTCEPTSRARSEPSPSRAKPVFERHRPSAVSHCTALSESRYRLQVTLLECTHKKLQNAIKRAVVERDGLQCSFVDATGHRCTATGQLEFHHHVPFAKGGAHIVENVSIVCRAHNGHAARRDFGPLMERYQKPPDVRHRPGGLTSTHTKTTL